MYVDNILLLDVTTRPPDFLHSTPSFDFIQNFKILLIGFIRPLFHIEKVQQFLGGSRPRFSRMTKSEMNGFLRPRPPSSSGKYRKASGTFVIPKFSVMRFLRYSVTLLPVADELPNSLCCILRCVSRIISTWRRPKQFAGWPNV